MANWKKYLGEGPWPFQKQKNKWGYLNNPRWVNPGVAPISYDGNESAEPVVWNLPNQSIAQSKGTQNTHNPCGHWHQPVTVLEFPAPIITMWQQTIDIKESGTFLSVGAPSIDETTLVVALVNYNTDSIIRYNSQVYDLAKGEPGCSLACLNGSIKTALYINTVFDADSINSIMLLGVDENTSWQSAVVSTAGDFSTYINETINAHQMCITDLGLLCIVYQLADDVSEYSYIKTSNDYGKTWNIAYLIEENYRVYYSIFSYNNVLYYINATGSKPFILYKSSDNGVTWSEVATTPSGSGGATVYASVTSSGRIYVYTKISSIMTLYYSDDLGVTWNSQVLTMPLSYVTIYAISANADNVVFYARVSAGGAYIFTTSDFGVSISNLGRIGSTGPWNIMESGYVNFPSLYNDNEVFVLANCGSYVDGTDYLGYLLSIDNGATWEVKQLPIKRSLE
jgi:hypothetical protein